MLENGLWTTRVLEIKDSNISVKARLVRKILCIPSTSTIKTAVFRCWQYNNNHQEEPSEPKKAEQLTFLNQKSLSNVCICLTIDDRFFLLTVYLLFSNFVLSWHFIFSFIVQLSTRVSAVWHSIFSFIYQQCCCMYLTMYVHICLTMTATYFCWQCVYLVSKRICIYFQCYCNITKATAVQLTESYGKTLQFVCLN